MTLLTRQQVIAAQDLKSIDVPVPEWGEGAEVRMRLLNARERNEIESRMFKEEITKDESGENVVRRVVDPAVNMRVLLVGSVLINEDGSRMFSDDELNMLDSKAAAVINRLFNEAQKINAMANQSLEEAEKN
jgi:hypothetical protein